MAISFIGSAINAGSTDATLDVSGTGRVSGDVIVLVDHAFNTLGAGTPVNVVPAGFSQIDTQAATLASISVEFRGTTSRKISDGTEGVLTGMAPDAEHDLEALVFRSTVGWGAASSPVFDHEVTTDLTINSPGRAYVSIGCEDSLTGIQNYAQNPTEDGQVYNTTGTSSTIGYKIFNSAPFNVVLTGSSDRIVKQGFALAATSDASNIPCGQMVM